jgi:hypothetical protein
METYKNSYSVQEDQVLWELHEIRHELHEELKSRPLAEFNKGARELFEQWGNRGQVLQSNNSPAMAKV